MFTERFTNSAVLLRQYDKVFVGSNQDQGYENPVLGFESRTSEQILFADNTTYFHYPQTANIIALSSSGLIEAGAIAGPCPYYSDKIWKKQADYKKYINWGDSTPEYKQTGVLLCSWLSGSQNLSATPIWMERWYNPGYVSGNDIKLLANYSPYDLGSTSWVATVPASSVLMDIPSTMTLDPGVLYAYYHVGIEKVNEQLDELNNQNQLVVSFENWDPYLDTTSNFYKVSDHSGYENNGIIENYSESMVSNNNVNPIEFPTDTTISFNGESQYVRVVNNGGITPTNHFAVNVWAYTEDWNNLQSSHILSHSFRGGWSIEYDNGFSTVIVPVIDKSVTPGRLLIMNSDGRVLKVVTLPEGSNPVKAVMGGDERYIYLLDNGIYQGHKHLYVIDVNGDIVNQLKFTTIVELIDIATTFSHIHVVCQFDPNPVVPLTVSAASFNMLTQFTYNVPSAVNVAEYYGYNFSRPISADASYIDVLSDNSGDIWLADVNTVYKNYASAISLSGITNIGCDSNDNIWVLHNSNQFTKFDTNAEFILSGTLPSNGGTAIDSRGLTFTHDVVDSNRVDYIWISHQNDEEIYKLDQNGELVLKIDTSKFDQFKPVLHKNASGYDWYRIYNYAIYSKQPTVRGKVKVQQGTNSINTYTTFINASSLASNEWHMFSLVREPLGTAAERLKFYVDSKLVTNFSSGLQSHNVYYEYESPITIGANTGKSNSLAEELKSTDLFFKGNVDGVRIYLRPLNILNIRYLYYLKYKFKDMVWNMPTGNQNYLEEVERFFKFKLPGQKAQYYNIKLQGLNIEDSDVRAMIEDIIRDTIKKVAPSHTELLNILWE